MMSPNNHFQSRNQVEVEQKGSAFDMSRLDFGWDDLVCNSYRSTNGATSQSMSH